MRWWFDQMRQAVQREGLTYSCTGRHRTGEVVKGDRGEVALPETIRQERKQYEYVI